MTVGMPGRIEAGPNTVADLGIRPQLARTLLVLHHTALLVERLLCHGTEQVAHAVALHPQRHVQRTARHRREVIGAVFGSRAIHAGGAGLGERLEVFSIAILGPLEHQVLEEMRKPGPALGLVFRAHAVPHAYEYRGRRTIGMDDRRQAVIQPKQVVLDVNAVDELIVGAGRTNEDQQQKCNAGDS